MLCKKDISLFLLAGLLFTAGCYQKVTCPAFQSQYLLDEKAFHDKFTLFNPDSTPKKMRKVKKDRNGIIIQKSYLAKNNEMKIIPMIKIYPAANDSVAMITSADSLRRDSVPSRAHSKYMTVVNNDQLVYNSLYGSFLIKPEKKPDSFSEELKVKKDTIQDAEGDNTDQKPKFHLFKKKQASDVSNKEDNPVPVPEKPKPKPSDKQDDGF
jgi:hypothetical protein